MGNSRSASFEVDHPPGEVTPTRHSSRKEFTFVGENDSNNSKPYISTRPPGMYADVYAESLVSENSSKESETISTVSSTSNAVKRPSFADHYTKTAPSRLSISIDNEDGIKTDTQKTRSVNQHPSPESFFDAIFATIEQEAGKRSPVPPRRSPHTMAKKRWTTMFS
ncbi:uncharacterized protein LOC116302388 [Actinia tenebrosa]|uniref:Uncharacterized protein LOC116302388 n=1 Tax=Actinia tenebrosa TaxID=6105 RepID=A0A6P8ILI8_ACTTE|nr:uncharacterized protein LOC116302388 [Actinia tenebrosa]